HGKGQRPDPRGNDRLGAGGRPVPRAGARDAGGPRPEAGLRHHPRLPHLRRGGPQGGRPLPAEPPHPRRALPLLLALPPAALRGQVTKSRSRWRGIPWRWIGVGLAVAVLVILWRLHPVQEWLIHFQHRLARMGFLGGVLFALFYMAAALLFVPGSVLTIGAGLVFGLGWGTVVVSAASTGAAAAAFLVARYLARDRVERMAHRHEKFAAIDRAIRQKGWKVVALLRLSPVVPFSLSNYLYGLTAVDFWPYLLARWLPMLLAPGL